MAYFKKIAFFLFLILISSNNLFADEKIIDRENIKAALLVDLDSGKVLFSYNENLEIQPASLTKILTLYIINEEIRKGKVSLKDKIRISENAVKTNGSKMCYHEGEWVKVEDLIKFMAIYSANDATIAAAESMAGTVEHFVFRMNKKAAELGMMHSYFVNPHGLPDRRQKITAIDILILARNYIERFPDSLKIHSLQSFKYQSIDYPNRNTLLHENIEVDGLKTGYVRAAGYHLVATAKRGDNRLMAIILGGKNPDIRDAQAKLLLEYGFEIINNDIQDKMVGA
ncbi:MAG: D-alanyl-D-alanine carboxypeptidase [Syntrophaceae bacterium]|nr:D-alanyl-D-alanine carboxypeptidase [Syntrophaceae bacterium]